MPLYYPPLVAVVTDIWPILFHLCPITVSPHRVILKKIPDIILFLGWAFQCLQVSPNYKIPNTLNIEIGQKMQVSAFYFYHLEDIKLHGCRLFLFHSLL